MIVKVVTDQLSWTQASWDVMLRVKSCLVLIMDTQSMDPPRAQKGPLVGLPPCFFLLIVCVAPVEL